MGSLLSVRLGFEGKKAIHVFRRLDEQLDGFFIQIKRSQVSRFREETYEYLSLRHHFWYVKARVWLLPCYVKVLLPCCAHL